MSGQKCSFFSGHEALGCENWNCCSWSCHHEGCKKLILWSMVQGDGKHWVYNALLGQELKPTLNDY